MSRDICCHISLTFFAATKHHKENIALNPVVGSSSPLSTPPSSPSKRRGSMSHYSDFECSPSKRRGVADKVIPRMTTEERKPLFTSEAANALPLMKVDRDPVYRTPAKGKTRTMPVGSPMQVDGERDYVAPKERTSFSTLFGSPMKVDRPGALGGGLLRKPLPRPPFVEIPARNRARGKPRAAQ